MTLAADSTWDWVRVLVELKRDCGGRRTNVYFIRSGENVKIGIAEDVERRLRGLQTSSAEQLVLIASIDCYADLEKRLHDYFAEEHLRGEWFKASDRILEFTTAISAVLGDFGEIASGGEDSPLCRSQNPSRLLSGPPCSESGVLGC